MTWIILLGAALLESVWALALKRSDGLTKLWPAALGIGTAALSVVLLSIALRSLPVGTAYAVWTGLGSLAVTLAGILTLGESATPARVGFLVLIFIGVIGLRVVEG